ncbi:MAG: YidC/Oxa1 family membrane protein insertase [Lachnospiraceae bacterium]|nr:YidC/Oxa1 family membrane protein insertase [Lachnospiraceae bacterium]
MTELYLTAYDGAFLGPIAKGLGWIMDKIYVFLSTVCHIDSIALTIIVFTVFIYLCLFPLTYKQQKFSVLTKKMQPELNAIQKKYKNKKDTVSMQAQQEETQMVYDKYGVSPMGSCLQMLVQMPILFALYRVFWNVPAYISSVKDIFTDVVNGIMATDGYAGTMEALYKSAGLKSVAFHADATGTAMSNSIIDVLYKLSESGWEALADSFPNLSDSIATTAANLKDINYMFILNISDTPWNLIKTAWADKYWILLIAALLVPIVSYLGQVINMKLMPTAQDTGSGNAQADQMAQQMKTMNTMMPLMTLFIAFTCPVGLVLYWTMGSVVRIVQQYFLNKHFEKINLDDIIEKNKEKAEKKKEKRGIRQAQIYEAAKMNTKSNSMASKANISSDKVEALNKAEEARAHAASGSMASKANLVKDFNERNNK